jgi:FlgD Ig-like domain
MNTPTARILLIILLLSAFPALLRATETSSFTQSPPCLERSHDEHQILANLRHAKLVGDLEAGESCETLLAQFQNRQISWIAAQPAPPGFGHDTPAAEEDENGLQRWSTNDVRVSPSHVNDYSPALASDSEGNRYAAWIYENMPESRSVNLFKSEDKGRSWYRIEYIVDVTASDVDLVVAEGTERYLFLSYITNGTTLNILRISLDDPDQIDHTTLFINAPGIENPRLATDASEFGLWYVYIVFNAMAIDNWVFLTSRTTDYGATWETPGIVGGYCGYPGEFYSGVYAHPDLAFGSDNLYLAFDNFPGPCTLADRDIFLLTSEDYGNSWNTAVQLTTSTHDEFAPTVGAVKNYTEQPTAVVAFSRTWDGIDKDIWKVYSQDDGATWSSPSCIQCTDDNETYPVLITSENQGYIHAVWWQEQQLESKRAIFSNPGTFSDNMTITDQPTVSQSKGPPVAALDPFEPIDSELCVAWTDFRDLDTQGYDIYYDAAGLISLSGVDDVEIASAANLNFSVTNPASPIALLRYELPVAAPVELAIYDVGGRRVRRLCSGTSQAAGMHHIAWDGRNNGGEMAPAGVYYCLLDAAGQHVVRKVVTLR